MDTITHGLIGALASKTGFYQKAGRAATVAFLAGALFPDSDFVVRLFGPEFFLKYHRGITHSVVAAPLFALALAGIVYLLSSFKNFWALALMVALGIYSHIFFDLITSFGTVIFDPLSRERHSWNLIFILDPFITIPVLAGLIISWRKGKIARRVSVAIFAFICFYLLICFFAREANSDKLADFAKERSLSAIRSSVYPRPLAPFFWMGILETGDAFYKVNTGVFSNERDEFQRIAKTPDNAFIRLAKDLETVQTYLWFADYPVQRYRRERGNHIVEFYDLRFGMIPNKTPFLLRVIFDENGSLEEIYMNGRLTTKEKLS